MTIQKIFFSYSRADGSEFALKLALDLKKKGFDVWIDQEDIRAGSEWDLEIEKALRTCDCLLFIETEKSVTSNNVLDEVYYALEQGKKVIPIIRIDSKTPFRLQRLQHIDFTKDYNTGLGLLVNELEHSSSNEGFVPAAHQPPISGRKSFYTKYPALLLICCFVALLAAVLVYLANNKNDVAIENNLINATDTSTDEHRPVETETKAVQENDATVVEAPPARKSPVAGRNKKASPPKAAPSKPSTAALNAIFAGDWVLADVEPKARLKSGYLKIEAIDGEKVNIKSYMQFYYFPGNETSFLTVFNAFANCSSCMLQRNMKLVVEDVAIGSRTIKTGEAGDTIMDAGSNKSIRASVSLNLVDDKTAVIKVQKNGVTELAHELKLEPFVYTLRFRKSE